MGKSHKKKNKKLEKRKKKSLQKKKAAVRTKIKRDAIDKRLKEYPNFYYQNYDKESVSEKFVQEVKKILNSLNFNDKTLFNSIGQQFLKHMKQSGFVKAHASLKINLSNSAIDDNIKRNIEGYTMTVVGFALFKILEERGLLETYFPYNDVNILPKPLDYKDFIVEFDGLLWKKTPFGRIYYSALKPKVCINEKEYTVAFSKHAIERICVRYVEDWKLFDCAGAIFNLLKDYANFEIIKTNYNNKIQYFLTVYDSLEKGCAGYHYLSEILEDYDTSRKYYYRIGYCPIGFTEDFVSAKTLLAPGMRGTPEYIKMKESDLKLSTQDKFERLANLQLKKLEFRDHSYYDALKWYHENGIYQVVELEKNPFSN